MKPASKLEKAAGSLAVEATLTAVAAAAGTPLAALLPVLAKCLASDRQKQRVEATLRDMNEFLLKHETQLATLTDQQYKFINEAVLSLLHTTNESKMRFLRSVVQNGLFASELKDQEAIFLSRIIRDISAEEAQFIIANFSYERIWLNESDPGESQQSTLAVRPSTPDGQVALGLLTLGLLTTAEPTWEESGLLRFTPLVAKLITLLRNHDV